jgi:hypothetical protein
LLEDLFHLVATIGNGKAQGIRKEGTLDRKA